MKGVALIVVALVAAISAVPGAGAVTYGEPPPFCRETTVRNYLAPFRRMPKLHAPAASGLIGFGSPNLILRPNSPLVVGGGRVGYSLSLRVGSEPISAEWDIATTLSMVDRKGRVTKVLKQRERRVGTIGAGLGAGVKFNVGANPAFYKVAILVRDRAGQKLGGYGFYTRVVSPTADARLGLDGAEFHRAETVLGRIQNFGTMTATYGVAFRVERLVGSQWVLAPESPRGPVPAILLFALPGKTGHRSCDSFQIPATMPPGRYRMVKEVSFEVPDSLTIAPRPGPTLTAEFDVVP